MQMLMMLMMLMQDERLFHVQLPTALPILTSTAQQQPRKKPPKNPNLPTLVSL